MRKNEIAVIMLNWNGEADSLTCIDALKGQTRKHTLIVVDNGSEDSLSKIIKSDHKNIVLLQNQKNMGFAGGVNTGIRYALENDFAFVALINNDAKPNSNWLQELVTAINSKPKIGIATGKLLQLGGTIDSTGDQYTSWGLPYPRGRDKEDNEDFNHLEEVFGATGGASLYSLEMLRVIGLFDEDFFAYYEDVDISFRAQLAGWKVIYTPMAIAYHKGGATSGKIPGLTTYMTIKNLPWLLIKNVPIRLLPSMLPRFIIAYSAIIFSSLAKAKFVAVGKGLLLMLILLPKKLIQRHRIQASRTVSVEYIKSIITYDLPTNAHNLRHVRLTFNKLRFWR